LITHKRAFFLMNMSLSTTFYVFIYPLSIFVQVFLQTFFYKDIE
jgi:hypothetical protein